MGISGLEGASTASTTTTTTTIVPANTVATSILNNSTASSLEGKRCTRTGSIRNTPIGKFAFVNNGAKLKWKLLR